MKTAYQNIVKPVIQAKSDLQVGQPDDQYEIEADQVAGQVMRKATDSAPIMRKCADCENEEIQRKLESSLIQREEKPVATVTKQAHPPQPQQSQKAAPSKKTSLCYTSPQFPNFPCLLAALKYDVDENLKTNAHHFFRTASLYPGRSDLMMDTFMRYGVGLNNLQTLYGFTGMGDTARDIFSYATGIGLKTYTFAKEGELTLDLPIPLKEGLNLDLKIDLKADPNDHFNTNKWSGGVGVGLSGSFDL